MDDSQRRRDDAPDLGARLQDLVVDVAMGDAVAFERLYAIVVTPVTETIRALVPDPDQIDDIAQEVALRIWREADRYDPSRGSVLSWVRVIAHHRSVDHIRARQLRSTREASASGREPRSAPDPLEQVQTNLEHAAVRTAVANLSPTHQKAIVAAYYHGHTYRQVAVILDIPEGTAKARLRDSLARIRLYLKAHHGL
ncbi:sigma-70 family RNA polymerase sigma factor [Tenggerimyces flavus]|uniref:Sigma-70 family RNA polymerase sigma factor n=1 Tax=Tenggerimyces flavus TaxID=1708749 RepID=A0ABV7YAP7_9ACTN|nr:sigma-70 family RNA polymerase sigma factor [Tenggerimyces flavus]MBM7790264.1 RNA polymerase sigma-70 factor (ECF subfamily) [Tenggerimyces flavus]